MSHSTFDLMKESLTRQLAYFEEKSPELLNGFTRTAERAVIKELIARYCRQAEQLIGGQFKDGAEAVVWIGSTVTIRNETDQLDEIFTIVLPEDVNPDEGKISFLSPIGQKLLLARTGSSAEIDSPGGKYWVTVTNLAFEA